MNPKWLIITSVLMLYSCDPAGTAFVYNNSNDTLKIYIHREIDNTSDFCSLIFDSIYYYNGRIPDNMLSDCYSVMKLREPNVNNDTLIEINIPPKYTIISNRGIVATSIIPRCNFKYAVFEMNYRSDTILYHISSLKEFYLKNDIKNTRNSFMWFKSIYEINYINPN